MALSTDEILMDALRLIQVISYDDTEIEATMRELSERSLNMLLESWSSNPLLHFATDIEIFPLQAAKASYTIGPDADFDTEVPYTLDIVCLTADERDYSLQKIVESTYYRYFNKTATSKPTQYYYKYDFPVGILYFWPSPDKSTYTVTLSSYKSLSLPLTPLEDTIELPYIYRTPLVYNLAVLLAPHFAVNAPPEVAAIATSSVRTITRFSPGQQNARATLDDLVSSTTYF